MQLHLPMAGSDAGEGRSSGLYSNHRDAREACGQPLTLALLILNPIYLQDGAGTYLFHSI